MSYIFRYILVSVICFFSIPGVFAQLSAPGRYDSRLAAYASTDSLYFFPSHDNAQLKAVAGEVSTFRWLRYNALSGMFDTEVLVESGTESLMPVTVEGGYRVEVSGGASSSSHTGWCFFPSVDSVEISVAESTCFILSLESEVFGRPIVYYNPANGQEIVEPQKYSYLWKANPGVAFYDSTHAVINGIDAPVENTRFSLTVVNDGGAVFVEEYDFVALAVSASFDFSVDNRGLDHELGNDSELSAPVVVQFDNTSKGNVTANEWIFKWSLDVETGTSRVYEKSPLYTFQQPGNYVLMLTVVNERSGCSSEAEGKSIQVMESSVAFPNVFTPNGDGVNDEFRPAFRSIKKYNIVIYNRWGKKVYESSDLSTGWDGKIGNRDAAAGVYFYVCEAEGYRKGERHRRKGSVTLLR